MSHPWPWRPHSISEPQAFTVMTPFRLGSIQTSHCYRASLELLRKYLRWIAMRMTL